MPLTDYPPSELEPHKLTSEETNDPYLVIHKLFDFAHLPNIRDLYWEWLKTTVTNTYDQQTKRERSNILSLYEKLGKLIEAAHILYQQKKKTTD